MNRSKCGLQNTKALNNFYTSGTSETFAPDDKDIKEGVTTNKLADFVTLDKNPLKVDPKTINTIQVLETIKEGKLNYKK